MWLILIYFTINLCHVDGKYDLRSRIENDGDFNLFSNLGKCIKNVIDIEFKFKPTVKIYNKNSKDKTNENIYTEKMIVQLMKNKIPTVIVDPKINNSWSDINTIREDTVENTQTTHELVLISFDNCNDVISFDFRQINIEMKHLIIIALSSNNICDRLQQLSNVVGKYDVTFVFLDKFGYHNKMFTFIPVIDKNTCEEVINEPTHINTCFNGILQKNEVFPSKKPVNYNKCPLRVGMATLFPFSQIKHRDLLRTYDHIHQEPEGSDFKIIKIAANYFNATIDLHYIERVEENPFVDDKFMALVLNGSLDVCAGGFYRIYGDIVAYSGIYSRQAVVWIYTAERNDKSWENLIGKLNSLYIFVVFYISYSFLWYHICKFDGDAVSLKKTLLYGWGALFGATSLQDARSVKQKMLNLVYLIMCIYLSAYISIQLYSFLTIREPPQMFNTNDEIMSSGRVPYLKESTKYFVNDKKYIDFAQTSAECTSFINCAEKAFEYKGLTIVLQGSFYNFQSATAVHGEARILRVTENILTVYNEMIIRKDSSVAVRFGKVTQHLFEAGITERLYSEAIGILVIAKAASANSNIMANSYSCQNGCSITLKQIAGVFYAWILGCTLSWVVFILEVFVKRERITFIN